VYSSEVDVAQPRANLSWGWEPASFYRAWAGFPLDDDDLAELKGPGLVRLSQQSAEASQLLETFRRLLDDASYAARIVEHYRAFRALVEPTAPPVRSGPRVGRNEPCPCGSGRKYKKCCIASPEHTRSQ
jgi:uncharacterized protein YecA (UPF0149 family)